MFPYHQKIIAVFFPRLQVYGIFIILRKNVKVTSKFNANALGRQEGNL